MFNGTSMKAGQQAVLVLLLTAAVVLCGWLYPLYGALFPKCLFHAYTGLHCPGCGTQRALAACMSGRFALALHNNLLVITAILSAVAYFLLLLVRPKTAGNIAAFFATGNRAVKAGIWLILLFMLLRNLPVMPFTLLAPVGEWTLQMPVLFNHTVCRFIIKCITC